MEILIYAFEFKLLLTSVIVSSLSCKVVDESAVSGTKCAVALPASRKTSAKANRANKRDDENCYCRVNGAIATEIRVTLTPPKGENFLAVIALSRSINIVIKGKELKDKKDALAAVFPENKKVYTLVCAKTSTESSGPRFCPKMEILTLTYVAESGKDVETGKDIPTINMKEELEHWGDFASLDVNKRVARLELFLSCFASKHDLSATEDFEMIEETCNVGCGFIPDHMMDKIFPRTPKVAIQVRIFSPRLGIFKGVLMRKAGIDRIQLPLSMQKVLPSKNEESLESDEAIMVITKQGRHPTTVNTSLGKIYAGQEVAPSFDKSIKQLSSMICRMLNGLGTPAHIVTEYARRSQRSKTLRHAWLVGTADPTGAIPEGYVFVPGFHDNHRGRVLITRSPCLEASDAKLLPLLLERPPAMAKRDWNWLQTLPFGAVVFGNSRAGEPTLPETIAAGDLDGDLYLICWSKTITDLIAKANKDRIVHVLNCFYGSDGELSVLVEDFMGVRVEQKARKALKKRGAVTAALRYVEENRGNAIANLKKMLPAPQLAASSPADPQLERIISHRKSQTRVELKVRWSSGNTSFEPIGMLLDEFPVHVVRYARRHKRWQRDPDFELVKKHVDKKECAKAFLLKEQRSLRHMGDSPSLAQERNWFTEAQDLMLNFDQRDNISKFVCTLYSLCLSQSKIAGSDEENIDAPEAMVFGRAFKKSLEIEKHRVRVSIPAQYKDKIKSIFHHHCIWT